jgi:hypothetical protein
LFSDGWAAKSKVSKLLVCGNPGHADATLDHPAFTVDALQFAQAQQIARVIGPILRGLKRDLLIFAREGWQLSALRWFASSTAGGTLVGSASMAGSGIMGSLRRASHLVPDCESRPI